MVKLAVLALFATFAPGPVSLRAQGSLTPPGAPAPTMKSLDQVEARTAITNTSTLVIISQPGSYYLTHNLAITNGDGIDITTNNVTLDLNGFTISSAAFPVGGNGIYLTATLGSSDVTILNGHIQGGVTNNAGTFSGPGFASGITYNSGNVFPINVNVSRISTSGCGAGGGFVLPGGSSSTNSGYATVVDSCSVRTVGGEGIQADIVTRCDTHECLSHGINGGTVSESRGETVSNNGLIAGIKAITAINCNGYSSSSGLGVYAVTANNCYGYSAGSIGLDVSGTATSCYGESPVGFGITAFIANACHGVSATGTPLFATHNVNSY